MATIQIHPLTPDRWDDFASVMGPRGAVNGCWCMYPRLPKKVLESQSGNENRDAMRGIVQAGEIPGLLAYADGVPAGWCAIAPRDRYVRLDKSRVAQPLDDRPAWSVVCLFITKPFRRQGISVALLKGAVEYAKSQGAGVVEGYPVDTDGTESPDAFVWWGTLASFEKAGFVEAARRTPKRPLMRFEVRK